MTTGFLMGYPNTSAASVGVTDGGLIYTSCPGMIYGTNITATGGPKGIRKWDAWPNGLELRARSAADLGNVNLYFPNTTLSYAQQIIVGHGAANSDAISAYDMMDLSFTSSFGVVSSSLSPSDQFRMLAPNQLCAFLDAKGRDVVMATPIRSGAFTNGVELNCIAWGAKVNTRFNGTENAAVIGSIPDGSGREAFALGYNLGAAAMTLYHIGPKPTALGITTVATIHVTDIDPTWTNVQAVYGITVDQTDGNLIMGFSTTDAVTHRGRLVKFNKTTGAVIWSAAVAGNPGGINYDVADMTKNVVKFGLLYYLGTNNNELYTINTATGASTVMTLDSGGLDATHGHQISEDVSDSVIWYGGWSEVTLHPAYLGNYCITQGIHSGAQMVWRYWPAPTGALPTPEMCPQVGSRKRAWSFELDGHTFYVMDLGQQGTFIYDQSTGQWAQFVTQGYTAWNFANGCMWGQRIVAGDLQTTDIWEMNPGSLFDNGATEIIHVVTGGVATRNRIYHSVDSFRLSCSFGQILDHNGATVTLSFSDDAGATWITMDTIAVVEGNTSQEIAWNSLGAFAAPGRIFKITDTGGFLRIEGADAGIDGFDPTPADQGG